MDRQLGLPGRPEPLDSALLIQLLLIFLGCFCWAKRPAIEISPVVRFPLSVLNEAASAGSRTASTPFSFRAGPVVGLAAGVVLSGMAATSFSNPLR